ncbi:hypothetical protein JCM10213_006557 [Rhodosporidiobolus nylandii]
MLGAVEFPQGRVDRPPEGGQHPPHGLRASEDISPDDLLRFLESVPPPLPPAAATAAVSSVPSASGPSSSSSTVPSVHTSSAFTLSPPLISSDAFALSSLFASAPSSKEEHVEPLLSSAFAASGKAFDAGDILLPFDLDPAASSSFPSSDLLAFPVFGTSSAPASLPLSTEAFSLDASLDSPLGLGADGLSMSASPLSEFLASPMFSLPPSAAPSTTFSELPLPSPSADSTATALPWFPPLPSSDAPALAVDFSSSAPSTTFLRPNPPPPTPALDAASTPAPKRGRKPAPTGFSASSTPLLPMDAPIQSRNSVIPSATSRKRKTAAAEKALAKRRKSGDEPASSASPDAAPGGEELPADVVAAVERKRLQNTLSARKSRARKQARLQELETENEALKARVAELERMLAGGAFA